MYFLTFFNAAILSLIRLVKLSRISIWHYNCIFDKNHFIMKNLKYLVIILAVLFNSCAASRISFNVLAPAPVIIPNSVQSIAIIDRSLPENSDLNKIEGLLTGEGLEQDRLSTQFVIDGLNNSLSTNDRYTVMRTNELMVGSGSGFMFPEPLSWQEVEALCIKYDVDALVSLETYDSDFIVSSASSEGSILNLRAGGEATVNCGFRMYYPSRATIIDEFHFSHAMSWESGGSILAAANAVLNKNKAIRETSFAAGNIYGQRITPAWYLVNRDYFKKSKRSPDLDMGARMMQLNDWDKALESLERSLEAGSTKDRGRAAHNLAVVYEILGELERAKEYTTLAWGRYKEKKSREYGYILTRRINDRLILENQLQKN